MRLYPTRTYKGQSFEKCKILTVPNQSMTLKDILKRFIRRESLPIERQGVYAENLGDLEKMANEDIVDQMARAEDLKQGLDRVTKAEKAKKEKAAKEAAENAEKAKTPGEPPGQTKAGAEGASVQAPPSGA